MVVTTLQAGGHCHLHFFGGERGGHGDKQYPKDTKDFPLTEMPQIFLWKKWDTSVNKLETLQNSIQVKETSNASTNL